MNEAWCSLQPDNRYSFDLRRGSLAASPGLEAMLGPHLATGLVDRSHISAILTRLGATEAANYFKKRIPDSTAVRHGDFGEIVATQVLVDLENAEPVIRKLRFRETRRWSMKLTDVFSASVESDEITRFFFGEAKAYTTSPPESLAVDAYDQLSKDLVAEEPEIMFFALDRLWELQDFGGYSRLDRAMRRSQSVPRALRMILVVDTDVWDDRIFELFNDECDPNYGSITLADDFALLLVTRQQLRTAIDESYNQAVLAISNQQQ